MAPAVVVWFVVVSAETRLLVQVLIDIQSMFWLAAITLAIVVIGFGRLAVTLTVGLVALTIASTVLEQACLKTTHILVEIEVAYYWLEFEVIFHQLKLETAWLDLGVTELWTSLQRYILKIYCMLLDHLLRN